MATYNGENMVFDDEAEQVTFEINTLIPLSKDPQFTKYLQDSLDELKDYQYPMKLRDKIVENYNIYVQRMLKSGKAVDIVYRHAIYGDKPDPEIKSPYSNSSLYSNDDVNPYSNGPDISTIPQITITENIQPPIEKQKNPITRTIGYIAGLCGLHALLYIVGYSLMPFVDNRSTVSVAFFNILFIVITGIVLFFGNTKLSKLIDNKKSLIVGFVFALLLAGIFMTWNQGGAAITIVTMVGSFTPLYNRKRKLETEQIKTP